jgi:hypothetical protein
MKSHPVSERKNSANNIEYDRRQQGKDDQVFGGQGEL